MRTVKSNRAAAELTRARAAVLDVLSEQPDPVSIEALAVKLGRHPNTLREQIAWLLDRQLIRRHKVPPKGLGRPAWHYEAIGPIPGSEDYSELAAALAWQLGQNDAPHAQSLRAGRRWGRQLCADRGARPAGTAAQGRRRTVALLDELGYAPRTDQRADRVALTRCPLLQAAHQFPDVVCAVHLGLVQSILEAYGADPNRVALKAFSAPGTCSLRLLAPASTELVEEHAETP